MRRGAARRLPDVPPVISSVPAMDGEIIASDLEFPEGPVWVDGALYFTEIAGGAITRWTPDGGTVRIADTGGGPNGATLGADGALYVTQNGGMTRRGPDDGRHPAGDARRRGHDGDHGGRRPDAGRSQRPRVR